MEKTKLETAMKLDQYLKTQEGQEVYDLSEYEIETESDIIEVVTNFKTFEEAENGAETIFKWQSKTGNWCFFENINNEFIVSKNGSWESYLADWDDGLDKSLMRFCLGELIQYEKVEEDYKGKLRIFKDTPFDGMYSKKGWVLDYHGDIAVFKNFEEAMEHIHDSENYLDPDDCIICEA